MAQFGTARWKAFQGGNAGRRLALLRILLLLLIPAVGSSWPEAAVAGARAKEQRACRKVKLLGEVAEGQEWSAGIGEGWLFRVIPIRSSGKQTGDYSGWDLAVDRADKPLAGYPDALLLATPPYGSLNAREIGTTFGMRAQDAIAWEPRRFHFLTSEKDLMRARRLYEEVMPGSQDYRMDAAARQSAMSELLDMLSTPARVGSGEFRVLDAELSAGTADAPAFAREWSMRLNETPHTMEQSGSAPGPLGKLLRIRFSVTLLLPENWKSPGDLSSEAAKCAE